MKDLLLLLLICTSTISFAILPDASKTTLRGEYLEPCRSWSYDSSVHGDLCRFRGRRDYYTTVREVQAVIDNLGDTLDDHETRITALEGELASLRALLEEKLR